MNPCPCGFAGSNRHYCTCGTKQIRTYQNRLSGPIRDRFDINLSLSQVDLKKDGFGEPSKVVRRRVEEARYRQYNRYGKEICNSRIPYEVLLKTTPLNNEQQRTLKHFSIKKDWSNRKQIKIIRLARTISDLQGSGPITDESFWNAIQLNNLPGVGAGHKKAPS